VPLVPAAPDPAGGNPATKTAAGEPDETSPLIWLGAGVFGAILSLVAFRLLRRPARPAAPSDEAPAIPAESVTSPQRNEQTTVSPSSGVPSVPAIGRRADLTMAFEPLAAQSTLMNLRLRYAIKLHNSGLVAAEGVSVRVGLFAGAHVNPGGIHQWFMLDGEPAHHHVPLVGAGDYIRVEGELAAPLDALNPITVGGRVLAVPLVAIDVRYGHGAHESPIEGQVARAYVIGRDPGRSEAKLAPFRIDTGPADFTPLGHRDIGLSKLA